ncbi:MAG: hypothetical protein WC399_05160 [Bacilli bacterium]|jgi:hypothetical protein
MELLSFEEMARIHGGEVISLTAVMAIMIIAISIVIVYRLFMSKQGTAKIPGGFTFEWK